MYIVVLSKLIDYNKNKKAVPVYWEQLFYFKNGNQSHSIAFVYKLNINFSILLRTAAREPVNLLTIIVNAYLLFPSIKYPA